jgi:polar amino acid transport system substrate-binding protein
MQTAQSKRFTLKLAALALAGLAVAGLAACGKKEEASTAKALVVGTDAAYAPFESQDAQGNIVGFDIDVVKAIAANQGLEVKFVNTPWEGIFNTLAQGDRDLLVSAITITDERKQTMDFSNPYFDAKQLIAVAEKSTVAKFADLKTLKVGVQTGTTGDDVVQGLLGKDSANIKRFESTPLALKELEAGGVQAVVADNGVVENYVNNNANFKFKTVSDNTFVPEQYGIAVRKGNTELLEKINKGLAAIKADGSYDKIHAQWFGGKK